MNDGPRIGDVVAAEQDEVARDLLAELGGRESETGLRLTGLEVATFLALKVAVPVVTGFLSREVWERYNRIRTRHEASQATAEVAEERLQALQVGSDDLVDHAARALQEEGVPEEVARRIAQRSFERVQERADAR